MNPFHKADERERKHIIKAIRETLHQDPRIVFAFLYGSFIDGPAFRDIDVAVFVLNSETASFWDVELHLARRIEGALPRPLVADVRLINEAPLAFRFNVMRGELLFSRDDEMLAEFMVSTARRYLDFVVLRDRYIREAITS